MLALWLVIRRMPFVGSIRAIAENDRTASPLGIRVGVPCCWCS